jgi:hypothetical protein
MATRKKSRKKARKKKPLKTRTMATIKAQHPGGDLVSIQISARLKRVPKGLKITKQLLADMIRHKAETSAGIWDGGTVVGAAEGDDPPGIELKITRWRNPSRRDVGDRGWRSGSQAQAWGSLRAVLAAAGLAFR